MTKLKYMFSAILITAIVITLCYPITVFSVSNGTVSINKTLETDEETTVEISVAKAGKYNIELEYTPLVDSAKRIDYQLKIDGVNPFEENKEFYLPVLYKDSGKIRKLSTGDEVAPKQKTVLQKTFSYVFDATGVEIEPYKFSLCAGNHSITIKNIGDRFIVNSADFKAPQEYISYKDYIKENNADDYRGKSIVIEAEKSSLRNDYSLIAKSDNTDINITPFSATNSKVNYIGGTSWSSPSQEITWDFDVKKDGFYKIGFNYKQNTVINGSVYRMLKIDGKAPFAEANEVGFSYDTKWQYKEFGENDKNPYKIYLSKGKHTLSLSVTLADIAELYKKLDNIVSKIGDMYLDIVMITGETPDSNRDYELYKQIPDFEKKLNSYYNELNVLEKSLEANKSVNGELSGAVKNMSRVCEQMKDNRYKSHLYLSTYYSYYQTLSAWMFDIKNMALSIDKIILSSPGNEKAHKEPNFFKKTWFSIQRFFLSFTMNYSGISEDENADSIKLWVNWGRDQVKVLNTLIQEDFTPETGIKVRVEQVNASLVQGVISNNSPDVYLHLARTEPVNLAMRGVLYNLSNFDDCDEVLKNFMPGSEIPYIYHGDLYALPDTQGFNVMFVRDDIFNELGIKVPTTWDDFLSATSIVQRKNMNSYLPYVRIISATTVNTGAGGLSIFPTMLIQNGQDLYNKDLNATNLSSELSVKIFKFWTDFYTKYKLKQDVNFYQRFRVGTIPIGVAPYSNYQIFSVAAPEIAGKWSVHLIPGTQRQDGTVDYSGAGSGTGCSIMNSSKNKKAAWEFLKWWVSEDTQYNYSYNCEAILGESGRVMTSNVKALSKLSWDKDGIKTILKQWENVKEIPEVPGSYYVSRSIDQAFWAVYNETSAEKKAITTWARTSDSEIKRKIKEYSTDK